jgi:hypothetical protein
MSPIIENVILIMLIDDASGDHFDIVKSIYHVVL